MKVTVHHFQWHDVNKNKTTYPEYKRTSGWIELTQGAEIIPGTAEEVDESQLDPHGVFHPPGKGRPGA